MKKFNFYSMLESGHRRDYIEYCENYLDGNRVRLGFTSVFDKKTLLFIMIEESFALYVCISLLRSLFALRTSGLLFRGKETVDSRTVRHKLKKHTLILLKKCKNIKTLSILPFYIENRLESICDDWIFDFQFLDKVLLESHVCKIEVANFSNVIEKKANGRKVISTIGNQDDRKEITKFLSCYVNSPKIRDEYLFVSVGKICDVEDVLITDFIDSGGLLINSFASHSQIYALYVVSNYIWLYYQKSYDQSSGILGRATQFGNSTVVRNGSIIEKLSESKSMNTISLSDDFSIIELEEALNNDNMKKYDRNINIRFEINRKDVMDKIVI